MYTYIHIHTYKHRGESLERSKSRGLVFPPNLYYSDEYPANHSVVVQPRCIRKNQMLLILKKILPQVTLSFSGSWNNEEKQAMTNVIWLP